MRALITGGKGFVGQWLAAHLKDHGDEVAVIAVETDVADGAAVLVVDAGHPTGIVTRSDLLEFLAGPRPGGTAR